MTSTEAQAGEITGIEINAAPRPHAEPGPSKPEFRIFTADGIRRLSRAFPGWESVPCHNCRGSGLSQDLDSQGNLTNRSRMCPGCRGAGKLWRPLA